MKQKKLKTKKQKYRKKIKKKKYLIINIKSLHMQMHTKTNRVYKRLI